MRAFLPLLVNHHHLVLLITLILLAVSVGRCYSMSPSSSAAVKRILVTGGNKGIGKGSYSVRKKYILCAALLSLDGWQMHIVYEASSDWSCLLSLFFGTLYINCAAICEKLLTEWKDTHVLLGARDREKGEQAVADLVRSIGGDCKDRLELIVLDTSSDDSVKQAAQSLKEGGGGGGELYGIINNAGVRIL